MRKKALLALMLVLTLMLSGCALIVKDQAVDNATEIIRMGDQVITKDKVKEEIQNELDYNAYYASLLGQSYDTTDPQVIASAQEEAVASLKKDLVLTAKAKELGLDQLTDEEEETVKTEAQESYDSAIEYIKSNQLKDSELEGDALTEAAKAELDKMGVTLDSYLESERKTVIDNKVREYAIKDVAVTDEELEAEYDSRVEKDKETYTDNAGSWATAANNGTTLYYTPAGVRRVKQILIKFKDEDQTAIDDAQSRVTEANSAVSTASAKVTAAQSTLEIEGIDDETKAQAEADLEAANKELEEANKELEAASQAVTDATNKAFDNITADADEVLAAVNAEGADWQTIMDEKNQDPGMKNNEKGYAVAEGMTNFDSAFVDAAMALAKPGDISDKVKGTSYGYYIIRYESDEAEGATPLDNVKETISSALLSTKQNETYNTTVDQWVEAAGIKVDLNALKD
jgi:hypothetical protein